MQQPSPTSAVAAPSAPMAFPASPATSTRDVLDAPQPLNRLDGPGSGAEDAESAAEDDEDAPSEDDAPPGSPAADAPVDAADLVRRECCARHCLRDAADRLGDLLASLAAMSKAEKKVCMFTSLSISALAKPRPKRAPRPRAEGARARSRFAYWLPLVGEVCRAAFMAAFGVSHCSLSRYRRQLAQDKRLAPAPHGNARNENAKVLDGERLARWLRALAQRVGEPVARRVRVRRTENGQRKSAMVEQHHLELPARYTWELLLREFEADHPVAADADRASARALRPSLASFRRILTDRCPEVRLRGAAKPGAERQQQH